MENSRVELPPYEYPPPWIPISERENHADYNHDVHNYLARTVILKRPKVSDALLVFNIRGGKDY
ncbi:PDZ domain-containing protein 11 [Armadillidium vulgare]|nr:PDZ domain-containing protein 11 [Armadillidium vulgare]